MTATARPSPHRGVTALLLVGILVLAACGSDGSRDGADTGPTEIGDPITVDAEPTTTTSAPTDTTTTAAPTTAAAPAGPVGVADPATAATRLYDAWNAGDRDAAAAIAEPAAIEAIFGATPGPYELYRGCDTGEFDTGGCLFRDRSTNNTIQIDLEQRDTGWVVSGAFFSTG